MNRKIKIILIAIVILDIIDGDFKNPSALDIIKLILIIVCYVLLFANKGAKK